MALEKRWDAVPPVLLTANGSTEGVLIVADTKGFYTKQLAQLKANTLPTLTVQIKRVVNSTTLWVGPPGAPITTRTDCSAYTTVLDATISAGEQLKTVMSMEDRMVGTYETDPVNGWRTKSVDPYGNPYTNSNPLPTNLVPTTGIPFTLGALALPTLVSQFVATLTYTSVQSDTVGNEEILSFYNGSTLVNTMTLTKISDGWVLDLNTGAESYFLLENGSYVTLENGSGALLLE